MAQITVQIPDEVLVALDFQPNSTVDFEEFLKRFVELAAAMEESDFDDFEDDDFEEIDEDEDADDDDTDDEENGKVFPLNPKNN